MIDLLVVQFLVINALAATQDLREASTLYAVSVDGNDAMDPGGVMHPKPEHDVGPGSVTQSDHLLHPEMVQHRDQLQPNGIHRREIVIAPKIN